LILEDEILKIADNNSCYKMKKDQITLAIWSFSKKESKKWTVTF